MRWGEAGTETGIMSVSEVLVYTKASLTLWASAYAKSWQMLGQQEAEADLFEASFFPSPHSLGCTPVDCSRANDA